LVDGCAGGGRALVQSGMMCGRPAYCLLLVVSLVRCRLASHLFPPRRGKRSALAWVQFLLALPFCVASSLGPMTQVLYVLAQLFAVSVCKSE